jgi:PQQ-dependent catabolism-associated beta-propeller protein
VITSETTNMVHWIDTRVQALVANTLVDQRPRDAAFTRDDTALWVTSEIGGTVAVMDVATRETTHTIGFEIPGVSQDLIQPVGIKLTEDDRWAFVALGPANHVAMIDRETLRPVRYIQAGRRVWHLAFNADQSMIYTTNGLSGDITAIDVATQRAVKTVKVGRFPWGAAVLPAARIPRGE